MIAKPNPDVGIENLIFKIEFSCNPFQSCLTENAKDTYHAYTTTFGNIFLKWKQKGATYTRVVIPPISI